MLRRLRVLSFPEALPLIRGLRRTVIPANVFECRADLVCSARSALIAIRVTSIKIEGMACVWDVSSNEMRYAKREAHRSVGVGRHRDTSG